LCLALSLLALAATGDAAPDFELLDQVFLVARGGLELPTPRFSAVAPADRPAVRIVAKSPSLQAFRSVSRDTEWSPFLRRYPKLTQGLCRGWGSVGTNPRRLVAGWREADSNRRHLDFQRRSPGPENMPICRRFVRYCVTDLPFGSWGFLGVWAGKRASPAQTLIGEWQRDAGLHQMLRAAGSI
jgi:hypothetical protein